jgi:DNA-binding NarL/FixJ family response regulator
MKVIVADDHFLFLDGVALLLSTLDFIQQTDTATTYQELNCKLLESQYDVLLLDIHFGTHDGREILPEIKHICPDMKIIDRPGIGDPAINSF